MEVMSTSLDKFYPKVFRHDLRMEESVLGKVSWGGLGAGLILSGNRHYYTTVTFISQIAMSVVSALHYLHAQLKVIHRDVKPSNILINRAGQVKICDFGISGGHCNSISMFYIPLILTLIAGYLVDSIAKTIDAGCKPYMAPERIDPQGNPAQYDIRSDVWSLGISMIEMATGRYPYDNWRTPFEQLRQVSVGNWRSKSFLPLHLP